jgi:hypothetical protein
MKQDIENIIKENLPEKNWRNKWNCHQVGCDWNRNRTFGSKVCDMNCKNVLDNISQINTSLIADEVLKVVGESKRDFIIRILGEQYKNELQGKGYDFYFVLRTELDNLSPNKENKNNG